MRTFPKDVSLQTNYRRNGESYATIIFWLMTRLSFKILRLVHLSIHESRVPFKKLNEADMIDDFRINMDAAWIAA